MFSTSLLPWEGGGSPGIPASPSHLSDGVLLSRCPRYYLQITSEDTLLFSNQETKAEMLAKTLGVTPFSLRLDG